MPPIINKDKCIACGVCADICPTDVFSRQKKKQPLSSGTPRSAGTAIPACWTASSLPSSCAFLCLP